jgi:hypothetical protein
MDHYFKGHSKNLCQLGPVGIRLALAVTMSGLIGLAGLRRFVLRLFLCVTCGMLVDLSAEASSSLTVEWNQSQDTNAVGYKVYYGTASHNYTNVITVGNVTSAVISGMIPGTTYYFAATAYVANGAQSIYSSEVSFTVPPANMLSSTAYSPGQFSFAVNGVNGSEYVVEASTNLIDWIPLQTNTVPFTFVDTNTPRFGQRFYLALPQ